MTTPPQTVRYRVSRTSYGAFGIVAAGGQDRMRSLSWIAFVLLWLFVFTIAWENVLLVPGFGTIGKLVGIVAFGAGILAIVDRGKFYKFAFLHGLMALFVIWGGFTYFWSAVPERTRDEVLTYVQLLFMVWLIRELASSMELQQSLLGAYVLGTYVSLIYTFLAFQSGVTIHYHRYVAEGFNPGDLALMLVLSVPCSIYLSSVEKNGFLRLLYRMHPMLAIAGIFFTAARGAFIDLLVALIFLPLSYRQWSRSQRLFVVVIGFCSVIAAIVLVPQSSWTRLASIQEEVTTGTLNERTTIWKAGFEVFRTHPIQGVGVNAFAPTVQRLLGTPEQLHKAAANEIVEYVAHNTFISVLVEEGLVGFVLFILIIAGLWRGVLKLAPMERKLWFVLLSVWTIGVMELTWEYRKPTWLFFGLLSAAITSGRPNLMKRERRSLMRPEWQYSNRRAM